MTHAVKYHIIKQQRSDSANIRQNLQLYEWPFRWILNAQINRCFTIYTIIIIMKVRKSSLVCSEQEHTI